MIQRFETRPGRIAFHDVMPGDHAIMHLDGRALGPVGDDHRPGQRQFTWLFEHHGALHYGQRCAFKTDDRLVVGRVLQDGAIHIEEPGFDSLLEAGAPLGLRQCPPQAVAALAGPPDRAPAISAAEICDRHRVTQRATGAPPAAAPFEGVAVEVEGDPVGPALGQALPRIRAEFEIVDIYVRCPPYAGLKDAGLFAPIRSQHLSLAGTALVVARRRHPMNEPRIAGIMLAKDEADVIGEVIRSLSLWLDRLYFYAGDAATAAAIEAAAPAGWARPVAIPAVPHSDGLRQFLLQAARKDAAADRDPRPMWVLAVQGDEIYHDSLREHCMWAQAERATVMTCQVATFFLHESQRAGWDWAQPLRQRLNHYIWDFGEHAGFVDFPWIWYDPGEHMRAYPHGIYPAKWASARPVRKHYPFRSPDQAAVRIADRISSGWQPHYANYCDVFMGSEAAGRPVRRYFGWFPEAERLDGIW